MHSSWFSLLYDPGLHVLSLSMGYPVLIFDFDFLFSVFFNPFLLSLCKYTDVHKVFVSGHARQ